MLRFFVIERAFPFKLVFACILALYVFGSDAVRAQESVQAPTEAEEKPVRINARALDANVLVSGQFKIRLWGIESVQTNEPVFALLSRNALEEKIDGQPVECQIKARSGVEIVAQCINDLEQDLSLFMLDQGYVIADRQVVYGTSFEKPYIEAETRAQSEGKGLWALNSSGKTGKAEEESSQTFLFGSFALVGVVLVSLIALTIFILRGFKAVVEVQNQSMDLATKERVLKEKERLVIASMIDAEVKTNKAKIEAYLVMYEELLKDLKDKSREPKYRKSGDIIQRQPALSRAVFDGNTAKLDLLGQQVASDIIHYYARIKTVPDYVELEPDTPVAEAISFVESAVESSRKLDAISDRVLDRFASMLLVQGG